MADRTQARRTPRERTKPSWRHWTLAAAILVLAVIVVQNSQDVQVELLFGEFNAPLILVLLIAAALGAVIGYIAPIVRRGRREERRGPGA